MSQPECTTVKADTADAKDVAGILNARILIVDDRVTNIRLLEGMLRVAGYTAVESTTNPHAVFDLHRLNRYAMILLDLEMPGLDGFQVMDSLRQLETDSYLPVLVITAHPDQKLSALRAGARDFVSKPFELAEVLSRVHNMLEVRLLHAETTRYSKALEQKVDEVEASREEIRRQSEEVKGLYEKLLAEQARSVELSLHPGTMVGVEKEERLGTPWLRSLRLRHPWLQLNLLSAFLAASVVGVFQETIDRLLILTMFLPVLADQAANTGGQALAITLRGLILGDLKAGRERTLIIKEALLGLLNGVLVGVVAAIAMVLVATGMHVPSAAMLGFVVFLAMIGSCIISGICGAIVPLALRRVGADPVTASTIFLTTATNVVSMGMLLLLAKLMVT